MQIEYLWQSEISKQRCEQKLALLDDGILAECQNCIITKKVCLSQLNKDQYSLFNAPSLPLPSIHLRNGIITYQAIDPQLALQACLAAKNSPKNLGYQSHCLPSNTLATPNSAKPYWFWMNILEISLSLAISGAICWAICYLILCNESKHAHISHDHNDAGPQKFHSHSVPRIGGIALFAGLMTGVAVDNLFHSQYQDNEQGFILFMLASTPVFFGGLIEDLTKNVGVSQRLIFSLLSAALALLLLGPLINRTNIPLLDEALVWLPFAVAFTILGVSGMANAINIIDGFNGLSASYVLTALIAISAVAIQVNDHLVIMLAVTLIGSLLGFLYWNWPKGRIFMGDSGAYLIGFCLAEICVILIYRNDSVSPWFGACICAYPITETLFSVFRRKFFRKVRVGDPDSEHLHQLIFKKLVLKGQAMTPETLTQRNSCVALYTFFPSVIFAIIAVVFWQSTDILRFITLMGCLGYILIYLKLRSL